MDAVPLLEQVVTWLWENAAKLIALLTLIFGIVYAWRRYFRWKIETGGGACNRAGFFDAIIAGDKQLDLIRWFSWSGINANHLHQGATALVTSVRHGQIETVRLLVSRSWLRFGRRWANPNLSDSSNTTPLYAAIEAHRDDIRDILLAAGAREERTVKALNLRRGVESGTDAEVECLIAEAEAAAAVDLPGKDGRNALLIAIEHGRLTTVRRLLSAGADANVRNAKKEPALLLASRRGSAPVVRALLEYGARAGESAPGGETPLIAAVEAGYLAIVELLLAAAGVNVDAEDTHRRTALMAAVLNGYETIARILREAGASRGEAEARLILAAERGDLEEVRTRLADGADPDAQGAEGRSALLGAARNHRLAAGELLLTHRPRANPEQVDGQGRTALMIAAETGDRPFLALLLREGADVNARRRDGTTPLMEAAARGHLGVLEDLLRARPEIDARRSTDHWTALMIAVEAAQQAAVLRLLDAGADPNVLSRFGESPLMLAIHGGHAAIAEILRDHGATVGQEAGELMVAARRGDVAEVTRLLRSGVPDLIDRRGATPLLLAVSGDHRDVVRTLVAEGGADVNRRTQAGTPLEAAIRCGSLGMVEELLALGASPDVRGRGGKTPLLLASERNHPRIARLLLEKHADPNAADDAGRTPLMIAMLERSRGLVTRLLRHGATEGGPEAELILAAGRGDDAGVEALLAEGCRLDTPGRNGETALLAAVEHPAARTVERLLEAGADPNVQARSGKTPLVAAALRGDAAILEALLTRGARIDARGELDRTALMVAAEAGRLGTVRRLLHAGNNPNARDREGSTALILAAANGHADVVEKLLRAEAEVDARGPGGQTALIRAAAGNHTSVMSILFPRATLDARDDDGSTALLAACLSGHEDAVTLLLARRPRPDVNVRDALGNTPLMAAILGGHQAIEQALTAAGATEGRNDAELIKAAQRDDVAVVDALLTAGVNINAHRRGEHPAVIAAIEEGHRAVAMLLLRHRPDATIVGRDGVTALIAAAARDDIELVRALSLLNAAEKVEAADLQGRTAATATSRPDIRRHLKDECGALLPDDAVYVTEQGKHYHRQTCYFSGTRMTLAAALANGFRPCSHCIANQ